MRWHLKLFALILALLMILACFASCIQLEDDIIDDAIIEEEGAVEAYPTTVEKKNYGKEFYLSVLPDVNELSSFWVEKSQGDAMSEAVYARQMKVFEYLGVEVVATSAGNYRTYVEPFRNAVEKKDGSVDCLVTHVQTGVSGFVKKMYVRDFNDVPGIDLEQDYWNREFMDALAIDGCHYLGFGDMNILYTMVIAFNKDLLDQYAGSMDKSIYQLVEDREWTLDKMLSFAQLVSTDKTGDGKTDDDIYGLTGQQWVAWINFFHASNINLVEQNEKGQYEISFMNAINAEKTNTLVKKLKDFSVSEYAYLTFPQGGSTVSNKVPLQTGRALMELTSTYGLEGYLKYDLNFGVLPYPLFDEYQKDYRSLQWGGYLCVPSYVENEQKVGDTLEVMSFYGNDILVTFYEKILGKQVANVPEDARMLEEYIWKTVCTDFGQTYGDDAPGVLYFLPYVTRPTEDGGKEMASYYNSFYKSTIESIDKFVQEVIANKMKFN